MFAERPRKVSKNTVFLQELGKEAFLAEHAKFPLISRTISKNDVLRNYKEGANR